MNIAYIRPKQNIPRSEKDADWGKKCVMYYKGTCQPIIDRAEALKLYRLANGELDEKEYLYVTNPINSTRPELSGYPAKLKNFDIISPNVMLLLGEKNKRYFPPIVLAKNSQIENQKLEEEQRLITQELQKQFVNELIKLGHPLDQEAEQGIQAIQNKVKNVPDFLTEQGQYGLEYIMEYTDALRKMRKGMYDYICTAHVISYRDIYRDSVFYEFISPIHYYHLGPPQAEFFEDGEAQKVVWFMTVNEVYDRFQDLGEEGGFTEELREYLERYGSGQSSGLRDQYYYNATDIIGSQYELYKNVFGYLPEEKFSHGVEVQHVVWRSQVKVGQVTSIDLFGNKDIFQVSEDYKVSDNETVEWEWIDEIWEGYCIGDLYYVGIRPVPIQRGEFNRPDKAKLLYNGRKMTSRHTIPTSIVKKGEAYQKNVNIVKYRAEETLAKNLDKIVLFPLGLIPNKEGWDIDKLMYYTRAFSFLFFDDTRPNANQMIQGLKELNLSMVDLIFKSYELVAAIKSEWDQVCGFNPQRKAAINADAGKGTTQIALDQSATMSEELFLTYEEFERRDYVCFLDYSKYTFSEGISSHFIRPDGTKAWLNIHDPDTYAYTDLGIFVKNGAKELNRLNLLKNQVTNFAQNGGSPKYMAQVIETDDFGKIHRIMDELEEKMDAKFQQEQQTQLQVQQSKEKMANDVLAFDYYNAELQSTTDLQVALITKGMQIAQDLGKAEASGDTNAINTQRENLENNALELMKNATKLKEIASKERIAKHKDETMLKNKVVGEK